MRRLSLVICAAVIFFALAVPRLALAHEQRTIAGKYDVEVGWDREPTLVNQPNAASIQIYKAGTQTPVEGVEKSLTVKIAFGGNTPKDFQLHSVEDKKGYYLADLIPTRTGSYIFTFVGDIEGTSVNERFESGPGRFDDVVSLDSLQFPQAVPDNTAMAVQLKAAQDDASSARILAIAGVALGVLGIMVGGVALFSRRRD
jgi:hypothetical protein